MLSIVIPTFNRRDLVPVAIDSALEWLDRLGEGEIIVIDDASSDGTIEMLDERYGDEIAKARITLERLARNGGVTAAKNVGARRASGDWIVFLDSDDVLIGDVAQQVAHELRDATAPVVFFRSVDLAHGRLQGSAEAHPIDIDLSTLLCRWDWGECLPIVRREAARAYPYVDDLRGYEGVAYARMVKQSHSARISGTVARRYDCGDHTRETNRSRLATWHRQERFTRLMLSEFRSSLSPSYAARLLASNIRARFDGLRAGLMRAGQKVREMIRECEP